MLKNMRLIGALGAILVMPGCATFCNSCEEMNARLVSLSKPAKAPDSLVRDVEHRSEFANISGKDEHVVCWGGKCPMKNGDHEVFWLYFEPDPFVDPFGLSGRSQVKSEESKSVVSEGVVGRKNFAFDDAKLTGNLSGLEVLVKSIEDCGECEVEIVGHTDSKGSDAYNDALGLKRASAVKNWLVGKGVDRDRIVISSRGEKEPVASNKTGEGRYKNRRANYRVVVNIAEQNNE